MTLNVAPNVLLRLRLGGEEGTRQGETVDQLGSIGFRAILQKVQNTIDWMVEQGEFEPSRVRTICDCAWTQRTSLAALFAAWRLETAVDRLTVIVPITIQDVTDPCSASNSLI